MKARSGRSPPMATAGARWLLQHGAQTAALRPRRPDRSAQTTAEKSSRRRAEKVPGTRRIGALTSPMPLPESGDAARPSHHVDASSGRRAARRRSGGRLRAYGRGRCPLCGRRWSAYCRCIQNWFFDFWSMSSPCCAKKGRGTFLTPSPIPHLASLFRDRRRAVTLWRLRVRVFAPGGGLYEEARSEDRCLLVEEHSCELYSSRAFRALRD